MKKNFYKIICFLIVIISFTTSFKGENEISAYSNTPEGNFEAFYNGVRNNYVFFNWEAASWDSLYNAYRPLVTNETTDEELHSIFVEMLTPLRDGHRALFSSVGTWKPKFQYEAYYNKEVVNSKYLRNKFVEEQNGSWQYANIASGITYIRSKDFTKHPEKMDSVIAASQNKKGIIIDLRNNRGGKYEVFEKFCSYFLNEDTEVGYYRGKVGKNKYTLGNFEANYIDRDLTEKKFLKKVVVLTDRNTFSAAELTTMVLGRQKNITVVGDTTRGAQGCLRVDTRKNPFGGFRLPNDWTIRIATWAYYDINREVYEGVGYAPDVRIRARRTDAERGKDRVLDKAMQMIKKSKSKSRSV